MTHCPLCNEPLTFWGSDPTCTPCVIEHGAAAVNEALNPTTPKESI